MHLSSSLRFAAILRALSIAAACAVATAGCAAILGADFDRGAAPEDAGSTLDLADATSAEDANLAPALPDEAGGCGPSRKSCSGVCVAVDDPRFGCSAASCAACPAGNAMLECTNGACAIATCAAGHADCDGKADNGCEADTTTSHDHCGSCGRACPASEVCDRSACANSCTAPLVDCGGSCVDLTISTTNCGKCGQVCPAATGGTPRCAASKCGIVCAVGDHLCSGACVAESPTSCGTACASCPIPTHGQATCAFGGCGTTCAADYAPCASGCCKIPTDAGLDAKPDASMGPTSCIGTKTGAWSPCVSGSAPYDNCAEYCAHVGKCCSRTCTSLLDSDLHAVSSAPLSGTCQLSSAVSDACDTPQLGIGGTSYNCCCF